MRMWMVPPGMLCDRHLLGEHVELHMFVGTLQQNKSVRGFIDGGLCELDKLHERHDELVIEMTNRGMTHKSPLPPIQAIGGKVDVDKSIADLCSRCEECRTRSASLPAQLDI